MGYNAIYIQTKDMPTPRVSIIIPAFNEAPNLEALCREIQAVVDSNALSYEIIIINDGSTDNTQEVIEKLFANDPKHIRGIQFVHNTGKAAALHAGFAKALGQITIQLDADLQDDPKEIPRFIAKIEEGYDLVVGWKKNRIDSFLKNESSKLFNTVTSGITGVKLHDHNCGFKAYKTAFAKQLNLYGELHRYIGVLAVHAGWKITEIPVHHRKRHKGVSKYGWIRFIHGFFDLFTVLFLTRYRSRPLHLFGYIGFVFFLLGFVIALYLTAIKLFAHESIGSRPLLLLSVMFMIMGVQIGVTGLVGEQITTHLYKDTPEYRIKKDLTTTKL